jgi:hypothetical protein
MRKSKSSGSLLPFQGCPGHAGPPWVFRSACSSLQKGNWVWRGVRVTVWMLGESPHPDHFSVESGVLFITQSALQSLILQRRCSEAHLSGCLGTDPKRDLIGSLPYWGQWRE